MSIMGGGVIPRNRGQDDQRTSMPEGVALPGERSGVDIY